MQAMLKAPIIKDWAGYPLKRAKGSVANAKSAMVGSGLVNRVASLPDDGHGSQQWPRLAGGGACTVYRFRFHEL